MNIWLLILFSVGLSILLLFIALRISAKVSWYIDHYGEKSVKVNIGDRYYTTYCNYNNPWEKPVTCTYLVEDIKYNPDGIAYVKLVREGLSIRIERVVKLADINKEFRKL